MNFGDIDAKTSREIFIRDALVTGNVMKPPRFLKENLALMRSVEELESRTRRRDLLIEEEALVQFYDERLGKDCVGMTSLIKWLKADRARDEMLLLKREQILVRDPGAEVEAQFPPPCTGRALTISCATSLNPGARTMAYRSRFPCRFSIARRAICSSGWCRDYCATNASRSLRVCPKRCASSLCPLPMWSMPHWLNSPQRTVTSARPWALCSSDSAVCRLGPLTGSRRSSKTFTA